MELQRLEHVNIRTADLAGLTDWYCDVLGMTNGARPPFDVPGAWLYVGDRPVVHLVQQAEPSAGVDPKLEHFALSASGLAAFLDDLDSRGVAYRLVRVPGTGEVQVNIQDPDGNNLHIDFAAAEGDSAGLPADIQT